MNAHPESSPEAISGRLFFYVVAGTVGFFTAMALIFMLMKV